MCIVSDLFLNSDFQDPHAEEFEDKEWTFVIENVSAIYNDVTVLVRFDMCRLTPSGHIDLLHQHCASWIVETAMLHRKKYIYLVYH